jgi:hypothetical protein
MSGLTGNGKSTAAYGAMVDIIRAKGLKADCFQITCKEYFDAKNLARGKQLSNTYTQESKFDVSNAIRRYDYLSKRLKSCEFLVMDELGQAKINQAEQDELAEIIKCRIDSGKLSIFISNHGFEKEKSLDKKTIDKFLGDRILSRLKGCQHFHFDGIDRRVIKAQLPEVSIAEAEGFNMPEEIQVTNTKGNPLSGFRRHLLDWMIRNPVFEAIDSKKRRGHSEYLKDIRGNYVFDKNGDHIWGDKHREMPKIVENLWYKDDRMHITGPHCGYEDAQLYQILLNMLAEQHTKGQKGIVLYTNLAGILKKLNLGEQGLNYKILERKLLRLVEVNITYYRKGKLRWSGGLLSSYNSEKNYIVFNRDMIPFYREKGSFTIYDSRVFGTLTGYASLLYFFLASHKDVDIPRCKPNDFWMELLSIKNPDPNDSNYKMLKKASMNSLRRSFLSVANMKALVEGKEIPSLISDVKISVKKGVFYKWNRVHEKLPFLSSTSPR